MRTLFFLILMLLPALTLATGNTPISGPVGPQGPAGPPGVGSPGAPGGAGAPGAVGPSSSGWSGNQEVNVLALPGSTTTSANACQKAFWIFSYDSPDCFWLQMADQFRHLQRPADALWALCQSDYAAGAPSCKQWFPKSKE